MKKRFGSLLIMMLLAANALAQSVAVTTVPSVDLNRYAGKWYEIARLPNWFQQSCMSDVTAQYALEPNGMVSVRNRCSREDGKSEDITGYARVADEKSQAKLKVNFSPAWLHWLPIGWGDYWIIALSPDYAYAVVGTPDRKYLWILSRTPTMAVASYENAVKAAADQGFDIGKLVKTRQGQ